MPNYKRIDYSTAQLNSKLQRDPVQDVEIEGIKQKIAALEKNGATQEQIAQAIQEYLEEHPITPAPTALTTDDITENGKTQRDINAELTALSSDAKDAAMSSSLSASNAESHLNTIREEIEEMSELETTDPALIAKVADNKAALSALALNLDGIPIKKTEEQGFFVPDSQGNVVMKYDKNGLDAAKVSQHFVDVLKESGIGSGGTSTGFVEVVEDGAFFVDKALNVGVAINEDGIHAKNILEYDIVES